MGELTALLRPVESRRILVQPQPGHWIVRRHRYGPEMPACIEACHHEPGNPENKLDTGPILIANIGYEEKDPTEVWSMKGRAITEAEYRYQMARLAWIREYDSGAPEATPGKPIELTALKPRGPGE